ncbi:MAG: gliding motility-associated C-terminal domain-containing protein [Chitinophagaceae bacterium]
MKTIALFSVTFLCLGFIESFSQINFNLGLVAYYPFTGNSLDASGNGNHALNFGATLTQDQSGNPNSAYFFNGIGNYMSVPNSPSLQLNSITIVAKVKPNGFYSGLCYNNSIIDRGNGGYNQGSFSLIYSPSLNQNPTTYCITPDTLHENYRITVNNGAMNSLTCITPINAIPYINTNQWDCVIGTFDSSTNIGSIYVNGTFRYSYYLPGGIGGYNSNNLLIGGTTDPTYPYYVNGVLDELRLYNRVLNIQEIDSICNISNISPSTITANYNYLIPNICDSSLIQFIDTSNSTGSPIINWYWNFGDGNTSFLQNPIHDYTNSGSYNVTLIVTNSNNLSDTINSTLTVITNPLPMISATAIPDKFCYGNSTTLTASGGISYFWSGGVLNGVPFTPNSNSTYTVIGTDANGCTNTSTVTITVNPLPNIVANANPNPVCSGQSTYLTASGGINYIWSNGIVDGDTIYPIATSTYTVIGTDANGCSNTSSITINIVESLPINISPFQTTLCKGDSVMLTASGANVYDWNPTSGLSNYSGPVVWAFPIYNTEYIVTGTDINGCTGTASVNIDVIESIDIQVSKNRDAECNLNNVQLFASGANNYIWTPALYLSNPNNSITDAQINNTTTFYVTGMTGSCTDMDSITVYYYNNDENSIFIPNSFSPNDDGLNDCYRIRHQANFKEYYFTIYNRWGERVFETNSANECWDGKFKNGLAEIGTYFYYLKAETNCGKVFRKGDITVIK